LPTRLGGTQVRFNPIASASVQLSQLPSEPWVIGKMGSAEAPNQSLNCETVVYPRTTTDRTGWVQGTVKILQLLAVKWEERKTDESLWEALSDAVEDALLCVDWANEKANRGLNGDAHRSDIYWLLDRLDRILTQCQTRKAETRLTRPATRTRAPETTTRVLIDEFLNRVEADTGQKVDKTDFWLRITERDGTSLYSTDREFRRFQQEDPTLSKGCRIKFLRVFKMSSEAFIQRLADRRQAHIERKRTKTPR
jgi:hypothetical protein